MATRTRAASAEERAAWGEYLHTIREVPTTPACYEQVEPHAWKRLAERLARIGIKVPHGSG